MTSRKLVLKRDRLAELAVAELTRVAGADAAPSGPACLSLDRCPVSAGLTCTCTIRLCAG